MRSKGAQAMATIQDFDLLDIRVGTIKEVAPFPEARKPAWKLVVDFGSDIGVKRSSAQIVELYDQAALIGRQVLGVVNFPPRSIGSFQSEVLLLGVCDDKGAVVLVQPERTVPDGSKLY
jgi:tRNA-binding protein